MRTTLLIILLGLVSGATVAAEPALLHLPEGSTKEEVIQRVGWPRGKALHDNREVWTYPGYALVLVNDRVVSVQPVVEQRSQRAAGTPHGTRTPSTQAGPPSSSAPTRTATPTSPLAPAQLKPSAPLPAGAASPAPPAAPRPTSGSAPAAQRGAAPVSPAVRTLVVTIVGLGLIGVLQVRRRRKRFPPTLLDLSLPEIRPSEGGSAARGVMPEPPSLPTTRKAPGSAIPTTLTLERLLELEWKRFEDFSAHLFGAQGWQAQLTCLGADGGVDVKLTRGDSTSSRRSAYVQCKARIDDVGVAQVRELFGVMAVDGVTEGYFLNTAGFTPDARTFAATSGVRLLSGHTIVEQFAALAECDRHRILAQVYEGDYRTPTCPKCGAKMRLLPDQRAYGCPRFPVCRSERIWKRKGT